MTEPTDDDNGAVSLPGELALGLLTGDALRDALVRVGSDPAFAAEVARWRGRMAPLLDEVAPVSPPVAMWARIESSTNSNGVGELIVLRQRVGRWRAAATGMTALAAALAVILLIQPRATVAPQSGTQAAPLVALLGDDRRQMKVVASWDPGAKQLVIAVPGDMPADPAHAHELWVIPGDGKPRSLGTMPAGRQMHMKLADALARLLEQGATIAISVEPPGGSRTGTPTGPVVVSGALIRA